MKEMGKLPKEEKPAFGQEVNKAKTAFEQAYSEREEGFKGCGFTRQGEKRRGRCVAARACARGGR
jgi:phenylalanyl-tRNA synthetase alpha chain